MTLVSFSTVHYPCPRLHPDFPTASPCILLLGLFPGPPHMQISERPLSPLPQHCVYLLTLTLRLPCRCSWEVPTATFLAQKHWLALQLCLQTGEREGSSKPAAQCQNMEPSHWGNDSYFTLLVLKDCQRPDSSWAGLAWMAIHNSSWKMAANTCNYWVWCYK